MGTVGLNNIEPLMPHMHRAEAVQLKAASIALLPLYAARLQSKHNLIFDLLK
jgi:hypothetical protein